MFSLAGRESAKEKWFVLLPNKNFEEKTKLYIASTIKVQINFSLAQKVKDGNG